MIRSLETPRRAATAMDLLPRPVTIHRLKLLNWDSESGRVSLEVHCSDYAALATG